MTATITTNANDFYAAFARVALATDKKDQRGRQMDHVAGQIKGNKLYLWATDSYRIHFETVDIQEVDNAEGQTFLLPASTVADLKRFEWNKRTIDGARLNISADHVVFSSVMLTTTITLANAGELDTHAQILRLYSGSLMDHTEGENDFRTGFISMNPRFMADIHKASRMHPRDKAACVLVEQSKHHAHHILAQFGGGAKAFRALIMPIRPAEEDSDRYRAHKDTLEVLQGIQ